MVGRKGQEADHKTRWTNKALAFSQRIILRLLNVQPPIRALGMCTSEHGWAQGIFLKLHSKYQRTAHMHAHVLLFSTGSIHHSNSSGADASAPWYSQRQRGHRRREKWEPARRGRNGQDAREFG